MKRIITGLLVAVLIVGLLSSCGNSEKDDYANVPKGFKVIANYDDAFYDITKVEDTDTTCRYIISDSTDGGITPDLIQPSTCKEKMK